MKNLLNNINFDTPLLLTKNLPKGQIYKKYRTCPTNLCC